MAEAARMANPTSSTVIVMGSALGGMMCVLICLISVVLALKYKKSRLFQDADDFELSRLQLKRTIQQQLEPNAFPLVPLPIADEDGTLSIDFQSDLCREKGIDEDCQRDMQLILNLHNMRRASGRQIGSLSPSKELHSSPTKLPKVVHTAVRYDTKPSPMKQK